MLDLSSSWAAEHADTADANSPRTNAALRTLFMCVMDLLRAQNLAPREELCCYRRVMFL
jgi:hypothetical protein